MLRKQIQVFDTKGLEWCQGMLSETLSKITWFTPQAHGKTDVTLAATPKPLLSAVLEEEMLVHSLCAHAGV